jgi:hypothetical protein
MQNAACAYTYQHQEKHSEYPSYISCHLTHTQINLRTNSHPLIKTHSRYTLHLHILLKPTAHPVISTTRHLVGPHKMPFQFIIYTDQFHTRCVTNIGTDCRYMYCSKAKFRNCTSISKPVTNLSNTNTQWNQGVTLTPLLFFHLRKKTNLCTLNHLHYENTSASISHLTQWWQSRKECCHYD